MRQSSRWSTRSGGLQEGLRLGLLAKTLIGVFLALLAVVAPINAEDLPDPFQEITGTSQAKAQGAITDGIPSDCPSDWSPYSREASDPYNPSDPTKASECVFEGALVCQIAGSDCLFQNGSVCPEIPWSTTEPKQRMGRSVDIPELCEVETHRINRRSLNHSDNVPFNACNQQAGTRINANMCVVRVLPACPASTYQTLNLFGSSCRGVVRRTWICGAGTLPRNQFNTCYVINTPQDGTPSLSNAACDTGSPAFEVLSCERYVGNDLVSDPTNVDCTEPDGFNMRASTQVGSASGYWCEYNASLLDIDCHTSNSLPKCATDWAYCLKRASGAGGCETVATNIRCRAQQAQSLPSDKCSPCVVLPFEPVSGDCPTTLTSELFPVTSCFFPLFSNDDRLGWTPNGLPMRYSTPTRHSNLRDDNRYPCTGPSDETLADRIHRLQIDYRPTNCNPPISRGNPPFNNRSCRQQPVCQDPPAGELDWASVHSSQLAIVNSPLMFTISGIPYRKGGIVSYEILPYHATNWRWASPEFSPVFTDNPDGTTLVEYQQPLISGGTRPRRFTYDPSSSNGRFLYTATNNFLFHEDADSISSPDKYNISSIVRTGVVSPDYRNDRPTTLALGFGECLAYERPEFRLVVEELWPDNDSTAIEELFGVDALDWWNDLSEEQQRAQTVARGLIWLGPGSTTAQREARSEALRTEVTCSQRFANNQAIAGIECRWTPSRSGYFRVTGAGAWLMGLLSSQRKWVFEDSSGEDPVFIHDLSVNERRDRARRGERVEQTGTARTMDGLHNFLKYRSSPIDTICPGHFKQQGEWVAEFWMTDRDCIKQHIEDNGFTPEGLGLKTDLSGLSILSVNLSQADLYDENSDNYVCLRRFAIDLRIECGGRNGVQDAYNYTETNPVGILVHEVRVITRMPS